MATQTALKEQRTDDLQAAAKSTNPAGRAHDLAQARALGGQIRENAKAANIAAVQASQPQTETAAQIAADNAASDAAKAKANTLQSASAQINAFLANQPGLAALDPNNELGNWMNGQTASLYGSGITDPTSIFNTIESTMNNPSGDPAAKAVFDQLFPGYNQKIENGTSNTVAGGGAGIAGYIQYANQLQSFANSAGLLPGTITPQDIGTLWAGDVSPQEVSTRLTTDYANAANAWNNIAGFSDAMKMQGMSSLSQLASWYINPTNTLNQINQQISAAQLGAESGNTGFGELSAAQANSLSAFLTNSGTNQLTTADASHAFTQTSLGTGVQGSASELAAGGFESTRPGQSSTGTVTQDQLLGAIEGNAPDSAAISQAQQARTAASRGGGGAVATANGAVGLGFANQ